MKHKFLYSLSIAVVVVLVMVVLTTFNTVRGERSFLETLQDIFLPIVFKGGAQAANPRGALYVLSSNGTTDGSAGGRSGMNALCTATDPETHFCEYAEVLKAFNNNGVFFPPSFLEAWVDSGGTTLPMDHYACNGWSNDSVETTATRITALGIGSGDIPCSAVIHVACCKWIP